MDIHLGNRQGQGSLTPQSILQSSRITVTFLHLRNLEQGFTNTDLDRLGPAAIGPEFTAKRVRICLDWFGVRPLFIEPGSHWENGYIESSNRRMRDELLDGKIVYTVKEVQVLIEILRKDHNTIRPHSSLVNKPPVPESVRLQPAQIHVVGLI